MEIKETGISSNGIQSRRCRVENEAGESEGKYWFSDYKLFVKLLRDRSYFIFIILMAEMATISSIMQGTASFFLCREREQRLNERACFIFINWEANVMINYFCIMNEWFNAIMFPIFQDLRTCSIFFFPLFEYFCRSLEN